MWDGRETLKNPDGTFDLVFGYFNRNWKQELAIPPGPDNRVEQGGPDAGQPTYFLPRRQRWIFRLRVPADFGNKEVSWTITANGRTETAYGNLLPAQEINDRVVSSNGNLDPGEGDPNEPPSIVIARAQTANVAAPLTLTATVRDDGLPKPRPPRTPRPAAGADEGSCRPVGAAHRLVRQGCELALNVAAWLPQRRFFFVDRRRPRLLRQAQRFHKEEVWPDSRVHVWAPL